MTHDGAIIAAESIEFYEREAKAEQIKAGKNYGKGHPKLSQKIDQANAGKATERAARDFRTNGAVTATRARKVYLDRKCTNVQKPKKSNNIFNLVNENIDWAKWSWNPVTGKNGLFQEKLFKRTKTQKVK